MAGLGRIQQRFNAAVITLLSLAGLRRMTGGADAQKQAAVGHGHPIHAKLLKSSNPKGNASGHAYTGYHSRNDKRRISRLEA